MRPTNKDRECEEADENKPLLNEAVFERTTSDSNPDSAVVGETGSIETVVFNSNMMKTSTQAEDLAATWGGRRSLQDSGRLRRVHSWSGGPQDDGNSEIRILRERLVRTQTRLQPGAIRNLSRRQRMTLASLVLVDFMSFCSMSVMAPFFPREAGYKGLSETTCGMVFSFYAMVMFVTSPLFGKFLPIVGAKFLFIAGIFVTGACNVIFGTLAMIDDTVLFTVLCFVVRGLEALGASAYSTASYVFVVNAFPDSIGSVLGILETFIGLGMSVGPAIGGFLYSIGGFGLPFYTLGVIMVVVVPINYFLLTDCEEYVSGSKTASIIGLFKIPSIIITGLVIVIMSNTWAFLDPTLEPHLRQFNLSTEQIGLIFLLFSSLYGIFSPIWGWVADRVDNHWCMMVWGLFLSTAGLLLLGPSPYIPGLPRDLWLDLVALSILGVSVALTLLPTFQGVLTSSIYEGGCPEALATYSAVAGVWSCCYSLGEVLGPAVGAAITQRYGFPLCATLCAAACFTMAVITLTFFTLRESRKEASSAGSISDSIPYTDTTWNSNQFCRTRSAPHVLAEHSPLLTPCSCYNIHNLTYGTSPPKHICLKHNKSNKSGAASVADVIAYVLKFKFIVNSFIRIRRSRKKSITAPSPVHTNQLYQNYSEEESDRIDESDKSGLHPNKSSSIDTNTILNQKNKNSDGYCNYLDEAIFGSQGVVKNVGEDNVKVKRNNEDLICNTKVCDKERNTTNEIIKHNIEKVHFYEQDECPSYEDIFDSCDCRDGVTYVRGTITVSSAGACEV